MSPARQRDTGRTAQKRRKKGPLPVGEAMQDLVGDLGMTATLRQYSVITSWHTLVGEQVAKVSEATRIENGILYVRVATAPWRAELTMRRMEIRDRINVTLGEAIVKDIRFR